VFGIFLTPVFFYVIQRFAGVPKTATEENKSPTTDAH
jgi:hypothetical protein